MSTEKKHFPEFCEKIAKTLNENLEIIVQSLEILKNEGKIFEDENMFDLEMSENARDVLSKEERLEKNGLKMQQNSVDSKIQSFLETHQLQKSPIINLLKHHREKGSFFSTALKTTLVKEGRHTLNEPENLLPLEERKFLLSPTKKQLLVDVITKKKNSAHQAQVRFLRHEVQKTLALIFPEDHNTQMRNAKNTIQHNYFTPPYYS